MRSVPDSALLGAGGQGLEITLKATQTARAVISRGLDDALLAAPDGVRRLRALAGEATDDERGWLRRAADVAQGLLDLAGPLADKSKTLRAELGREYKQSTELFDLAKEYCVLHATAACVLTYVHNHGVIEDPLPSGSLPLLQLERLSRQLFPHQAVTGPAEVDDVLRVLRRFYYEKRLFSYWQFPLAGRATDVTGRRSPSGRLRSTGRSAGRRPSSASTPRPRRNRRRPPAPKLRPDQSAASPAPERLRKRRPADHPCLAHRRRPASGDRQHQGDGKPR